jgi:pimeloyl-ACP methyl ester carboxylesterase
MTLRRYVLIHGSWHGAWCWFKVAPRLRAHGKVSVPNLPGRGRDAAWAPAVTLGAMLRSVSRQLPEGEQSTVVVHSRYGVLATALAEAFPRRIRRVIYLASYLLPSGWRASDAFAADTDSYLRPFVELNRLGVWDRLKPEAYVEGLYADCSPEDVELASALLCREPSLPAIARVRTTAARSGSVPRAYIRLTEDRAVTLRLQDQLIERAALDRVESVAASHSAYFSRPDELTRTIVALDRD